jgi:Cof subfamily protein (haloacid dehalogenase superfamily)
MVKSYTKNKLTKTKGVFLLKKRLIALDMDGTLVSSNHKISEANKKAIKKAQAAGHIVMICSGRPHDGLIVTLSEEGFSDLPISGSNGAVTLIHGEIIHHVSMNPKSAEKLYDWLDDHEYPFKIYTDQGIYGPETFFQRARYEFTENKPVDKPHFSDLATMEEYTNKFPVTYTKKFAEIPESAKIFKFFMMTPNMEKKAAAQEFAKLVGGLTITSSYEDNVELSDEMAHKGTGLSAIAKHFNISMENTVAMGDNYNDSGMLEAAGLAVAMGNAEDGIKKIADVVTLTNDDDGVAHAINKYILEQE